MSNGNSIALARFARRYAKPLWPWYAWGFVALAATNLITLEIPQLAKVVINSISNAAGKQRIDPELAQIAILIMVSVCFRS
jgi:ATP-binding cassette subfamily B protein